MKLSKLIYLCVKNVRYSDDSVFTYTNFIENLETYKKNSNYSIEINNVFMPLNEAISRLSDLDRIEFRIRPVTVNDNVFDLPEHLKEVIAVAQLINGSYKKLQARKYPTHKMLITSYVFDDKPVFIEYKEEIPYFSEDDLEDDVDLEDYGITDTMTNYIVEYVKGLLQEVTSPELGNLHRTNAERYFANLTAVSSALSQSHVEQVNKIGC